MENVKKTAVLHKLKKIYKDLISDSGTNAPRNTKVVENARYICQKKTDRKCMENYTVLIWRSCSSCCEHATKQ